MEKIILASASPRRKELMALLPWPYEVITLPVDECLPEDYKGATYVQALALKKARAVAEAYPDRLVIGADTMVCLEGHMLGKPRDILQAEVMLQNLSAKTHEVLSGVAIVHKNLNIEEVFHQSTQVEMAQISLDEIRQYIETKEPMDKAGSYAIQGLGAKFVKQIIGDYYNVVGLPLHMLYKKLSEILTVL